MVGSATTVIDDRGVVTGGHFFPTDPVELGREILVRNCFAHPAVVFRRSAFEAAGGYRELFPRAEDYDLLLLLAEHGAIRNTEQPLLRYRLHAGQVTRRHLQEQAASTVAAQTAARARRAYGREPPLDDLAIDQAAVKAREVEATVDLAAQYVDARRLEDAEELLATLTGLPPDLTVSVLRQQARLAHHQGRRGQAAILLVRSYLRSKRKSPQP